MVLGILLACSVGEKQVVIPQSPMGLLDFYMALEHDASSFGYSQGEWTEDYGDAAAFGSYYYSHAGKHENNEEYIQIALETKEYNLGVISTATDDFSWMLSHLEEVAEEAALKCVETKRKINKVDDALVSSKIESKRLKDLELAARDVASNDGGSQQSIALLRMLDFNQKRAEKEYLRSKLIVKRLIELQSRL